jgi:hypothetical protein
MASLVGLLVIGLIRVNTKSSHNIPRWLAKTSWCPDNESAYIKWFTRLGSHFISWRDCFLVSMSNNFMIVLSVYIDPVCVYSLFFSGMKCALRVPILLLWCPAVYLIVCPIPLVTKEDPNRDRAIYINLVKLSASRQCLWSCYALAVGTNPGLKIFLDRQNVLQHVISQQMALLQRQQVEKQCLMIAK